MLWTKKKKVTVFFGSIGAILLLTASIATPLVLINSKKDKKNSRARDKDQIDKQNVIDKQIVDDVVKLFNPLVKATNGTPTTIATKTITLPSALKLKTKAEDIGFIDPSLNKRNGAIVKFKVKSIDDKYGTLEVEVLIDKGGTFETLTFKLKDYQTYAQALANAKSVAKAFINRLTYPKQNDAKHDASLFGNIDRAKQAALTAIDNAKKLQVIKTMASSPTAGTELVKVKTAIDLYVKSTGTTKILNDAKAKATKFINELTYPLQDDKAHDAKLFGNIDRAKQAALTAIDEATIPTVIEAMASSPTAGTELVKVKAAIDLYVESTGTTKILNDAEVKAANDKITAEVQNKTGTVVKKTQVNNGATPTNDNLEITAPKGFTYTFKSATAVNDQGKSTVTVDVNVDPIVSNVGAQPATFEVSGFETKEQAANDKITAEVKKHTGIVVKKTQVDNGATPTKDNLEITAPKGFTYTFKSATAVNEQGKSTVTVDVNVDPIVSNVSAQPTTFEVSGFETKADADQKVQVKALQDAKVKAKNFINGLAYPNQDNKAHDAKLFENIAIAKQAALTAIDNAKTPQAIETMALSPTAGTELVKVKAAIDSYIKSTGTTKILNDEKARIEGLERETITKNVVFGGKINWNLADLKIGQGVTKIRYRGYPPKILKDGDYDVILQLDLGSQTVTAKRKIHIIGIDVTTMGILSNEQARVNTFIYSQKYLEKDRFEELPFIEKMKLLGLVIKPRFWYQWNWDQNGIKIEVSIRNSDGQTIYYNSNTAPNVIKLKWLYKNSIANLPTYSASAASNGKSFDSLDIKMKTESQENILETFKDSRVYGIPELSQGLELYKINVKRVTNRTITYMVWIKDTNGKYDTKEFDIKFN